MKQRNLEILLKVRKVHEGLALSTLGTERQAVSDLTHQLQEASANLAQLLIGGVRGVEETKVLVAQRASASARSREINDALYLAQLRAEQARQTWLAASRESEIGQRLVDQEARLRDQATQKTERHEADDRARGRLVVRGRTHLEQGDDR